MSSTLWEQCLHRLQEELPHQQFNTWIRPLQVEENESAFYLLAPNRFVLDWVNTHYLERIATLMAELKGGTVPNLMLEVGSRRQNPEAPPPEAEVVALAPTVTALPERWKNTLNPAFTFENFVEGKSNQLARAAATQVGQNPGSAYNPLFIYGGVGLGKTHLMHATGNLILQKKPRGKVVYLHSEGFVADMVKALQRNAINEFKGFYRSVDALLIDDIQFFARKERSQEEFFHTFNALLEGQHQVILACDRYPKEIDGLEERLKSRFGWGLTVAIEPPELETRVAILMSKAEQAQISLPDDVAFFIAKRIRSNVRELEGTLRRVIASAHFTGKPITLDFARAALESILPVCPCTWCDEATTVKPASSPSTTSAWP